MTQPERSAPPTHEAGRITHGLEVFTHARDGYQPLVYSKGWMVALLNHEPGMQVEKALEIERHARTDEVFILLRGRAAFYLVSEGDPLEVVEMEAGKVYNVKQGTWHNLLATREAAFAIVEDRDTDKFDTEIRPLTSQERQALLDNLPDWLK